MRVAINLLTDHPDHPVRRPLVLDPGHPRDGRTLTDDEEFHLLVSPKSRPLHQGYGDRVRYLTFPWSNESRDPAHPDRAPLRARAAAAGRRRRLQHPDGPDRPARPALVAHFKTMHAFTAPEAIRP